MEKPQLKIEYNAQIYSDLEYHRHKLLTDKAYFAKTIADNAIKYSALDKWLAEDGKTRLEIAERVDTFHYKLMENVIELIDTIKINFNTIKSDG